MLVLHHLRHRSFHFSRADAFQPVEHAHAQQGSPFSYARSVLPAEKPEGRRPGCGNVTRTAAQTRILDAALDLFADHGVSGTSLQMIADAIGVTKAAVYHQFKTKEEIVIAVTEMELAHPRGRAGGRRGGRRIRCARGRCC